MKKQIKQDKQDKAFIHNNKLFFDAFTVARRNDNLFFDALTYASTIGFSIAMPIIAVVIAITVNFISQKQRVMLNMNLQSFLNSDATEPLLLLTSIISLVTMLYLIHNNHHANGMKKNWVKLSKIILVISMLYQVIPYIWSDLIKSCSITVLVAGIFFMLVVMLIGETVELLHHVNVK